MYKSFRGNRNNIRVSAINVSEKLSLADFLSLIYALRNKANKKQRHSPLYVT